MIAHTLFGEGGSSISGQSSANIMQVALNRINAYYGRRGMSVSSLSREDFAKLLVRVMAMPYDYETEAGQHGQEPAFNAFSRPHPHYNTQGTKNWDETMRLVQSILDSNGQVYPNGLTPTIGAEVTTYCSQDALLDPPADPTPDDGNNGIAMIEEGGGRKQYYFNDGRIPNCRYTWHGHKLRFSMRLMRGAALKDASRKPPAQCMEALRAGATSRFQPTCMN